ncbi:MAG: alpha/beta hydrolase [Anaerolineales bacterium]|nr:alpha/beta hydrolase [Anaerolineales bacterium]
MSLPKEVMRVENLQETNLYYARYGSGTPMVLLHGYPLDHSVWEPVVPLLSAQYDLIAPDLRGFGRTRAIEDSCTVYEMASDIVHLLDRLELGSVYIAGHSMGGYISLALIDHWPERVSGLALVASKVMSDDLVTRKNRYAVIEQIKNSGVEIVARSMPARLTQDTALRIKIASLIRDQSSQGLICAQTAMAERPDFSKMFSSIRIPVVVIAGSEDSIVPVAAVEKMAGLNSRARLSVVKEAGHMPMMEDPETTAAGLIALTEKDPSK